VLGRKQHKPFISTFHKKGNKHKRGEALSFTFILFLLTFPYRFAIFELIKTIKMVTKVKYYTLIFFAIVLFLTSCTRPKQNNTKERFVVTSNSLNIRIDPTQLSKPIGTLSKGDTITALASDNYWIMVKVGDQAGFVSNQYLKRIGPIMIPAFITLVERNASIEKWQFWVIAIILILLWVG